MYIHKYIYRERERICMHICTRLLYTYWLRTNGLKTNGAASTADLGRAVTFIPMPTPKIG